MITIHKFTLEIGTPNKIKTHRFAKAIKAMVQNDHICVWAIVNTDGPEVYEAFEIFGTGHTLPHDHSDKLYLDSVMQGPFVWHVFTTMSLLR